MMANYTLHVSVNDTIQMPGLTKELASCPITYQEIVYMPDPNKTRYEYPPGIVPNATWNETSNNLTIIVDNNVIKGLYQF